MEFIFDTWILGVSFNFLSWFKYLISNNVSNKSILDIYTKQLNLDKTKIWVAEDTPTFHNWIGRKVVKDFYSVESVVRKIESVLRA